MKLNVLCIIYVFSGIRDFSAVEVSPTLVVSFTSFAYTVYDISGDSPGHFCEIPRDNSC